MDSLYEAPLDELLALFRQETKVVQVTGVPAKVSSFTQEEETISMPPKDKTPLTSSSRMGESRSVRLQVTTTTADGLSSDHNVEQQSTRATRLVSEIRLTDFVPHGTTYYIDVLEALKRMDGV